MGFQELVQIAQSGDAEAMRQVAVAYMRGDGVAHDFDKALGWTYSAAEQGNVDAMAEIADVYRKARMYEEAFLWEEKAANHGRAQSMYNLSVHYRDGLGIPINEEKQMYWYEKGQENGFHPIGN